MSAPLPLDDDSIHTAGRPQEALQLPYEKFGSSLGPAASEELVMPTTKPTVTKVAQSCLIPTPSLSEMPSISNRRFPCKAAVLPERMGSPKIA